VWFALGFNSKTKHVCSNSKKSKNVNFPKSSQTRMAKRNHGFWQKNLFPKKQQKTVFKKHLPTLTLAKPQEI